MEYKKGQENRAADALSCRDEEAVSLAVISYPTLDWLQKVKSTYLTDPKMNEMFQKFQAGVSPSSKFSIRDDILLYKHILYIGFPLREKVLHFIHASPVAGHSGYDKTMAQARRDFY